MEALLQSTYPTSTGSHCVVLGINHRTCPVELRDRLGFHDAELSAALVGLRQLPGLGEVVILSTCNRTEIYAATPYPDTVRGSMLMWWGESRRVDAADLEPYCYWFAHEIAVSHLFSVSASIDSMVVGEGQILGQVRNAYQAARNAGTAGLFLNHLFQMALSVGKKIRQDTPIGEGAVSIAYAAVQLCRSVLGDLSQCRAGVVGTGEMGTLALVNLMECGVSQVAFFNRSRSNAQALADRHGGEVYELSQLPSLFREFDILISCTGASGYVLDQSDISALQLGPTTKHQVVVDIAAPRDIHPAIGGLPGVRLYSIDDLQAVVQSNRERRKSASRAARVIVEESVGEFREWVLSLEVVPMLRMLRERFQQLADSEVERLAPKSDEERARLHQLADGIVAKIMHQPSVRMRKMGSAGLSRDVFIYTERLFGLQDGQE